MFLKSYYISSFSQPAPKHEEEVDEVTKADDTSSSIPGDVQVSEVTEAPMETVVQNTLESEVSDNLISQPEIEAPVSEPTAASEINTATSEASVSEHTVETKMNEKPTEVLQVSDTPASEVVSTEGGVPDAAENLAKTSDSGTLEDGQTDSVPETEDKTDDGAVGSEESSVNASTVEPSKLEMKYKYSEGLCF
jgi:hypothetical protein